MLPHVPVEILDVIPAPLLAARPATGEGLGEVGEDVPLGGLQLAGGNPGLGRQQVLPVLLQPGLQAGQHNKQLANQGINLEQQIPS